MVQATTLGCREGPCKSLPAHMAAWKTQEPCPGAHLYWGEHSSSAGHSPKEWHLSHSMCPWAPRWPLHHLQGCAAVPVIQMPQILLFVIRRDVVLCDGGVQSHFCGTAGTEAGASGWAVPTLWQGHCRDTAVAQEQGSSTAPPALSGTWQGWAAGPVSPPSVGKLLICH